MRLFVMMALFISVLMSCGGTCVNCHPNLLKNGNYDKDHIILKSCDGCHKNHEGAKNSPCGGDCWDCHVIKEVMESGVIEHKNLRYCLSCHVKLNRQFTNDMNLKKLF